LAGPLIGVGRTRGCRTPVTEPVVQKVGHAVPNHRTAALSNERPQSRRLKSDVSGIGEVDVGFGLQHLLVGPFIFG
jgi:hypothetical protein